MKTSRVSALYFLTILLLFAAIAVVRWDLAGRQLEIARAVWAQGGVAAGAMVAAVVSFFALLGFVAWVASRRPSPRRDAWAVGIAFLLGYGIEAWGTRTGLYAYYTGETPPLWIVPAWPLGVLVVDRIATRAREWIAARGSSRGAGGRGAVRTYWALAVVTMAFFLVFVRPAWSSPITWLVAVLLALALFLRADPEHDLWTLLAGYACVFLADAWGTGSACYEYYLEVGGSLGRQVVGVAFGMVFDAAIVLVVWRGVGMVAGQGAGDGRRRPATP